MLYAAGWTWPYLDWLSQPLCRNNNIAGSRWRFGLAVLLLGGLHLAGADLVSMKWAKTGMRWPALDLLVYVLIGMQLAGNVQLRTGLVSYYVVCRWMDMAISGLVQSASMWYAAGWRWLVLNWLVSGLLLPGVGKVRTDCFAIRCLQLAEADLVSMKWTKTGMRWPALDWIGYVLGGLHLAVSY